jgi:hypothetical protein
VARDILILEAWLVRYDENNLRTQKDISAEAGSIHPRVRFEYHGKAQL